MNHFYMQTANLAFKQYVHRGRQVIINIRIPYLQLNFVKDILQFTSVDK